ncbi:hypothetical protein [Exiguobacterium sp. 22311]|uniref:hypothetical protein n=1 Tax=Exiguobacterium sp. 22311 TaxID=3453907 RepID=UPI003F8418C1
MKTKFLFWNVNRKNMSELIISMVLNLDIDVIVLAEFPQKSKSINQGSESKESIEEFIDIKEFTKKLKDVTKKNFKSRFISGQKIVLIDNFENELVLSSKEDKRMSYCKYEINNKKFMITGVHLRDKYNNDVTDLYEDAHFQRLLVDTDAEDINKIIVVGDFNMNPFEKGMMGFSGFNAIFSKEEVIYHPEGRTFFGNSKTFYYNASWEAYNYKETLGTYYYDQSSSSYNPYWNMFDQALFSADLINSYVPGSFSIINEIEALNISLLKNKRSKTSKNQKKVINSEDYSDHLPITFEVNL